MNTEIIPHASGSVLPVLINRAGKPASLRFVEFFTVNLSLIHIFIERLATGASIAEIARQFKTTRQTVMRVKEAALKSQQMGEPLLL